jgi:hypothetical protein
MKIRLMSGSKSCTGSKREFLRRRVGIKHGDVDV